MSSPANQGQRWHLKITIMKTAVHELTDKNMEDVAAYLEEFPAQ